MIDALMTLPTLTGAAEPASVLEGHPVKVTFTLQLNSHDKTGTTTPGRVVITHGENSVSVPVPAISAGGKYTRSAVLNAGPAGLKPIELHYFSDANRVRVDEFMQDGPEVAYGEVPLRVMARFFVSLDQMNVGETRAATKDTDFIWLGASLDEAEPKSAHLFMPNVGGGPHRIDIAVGPFDLVPGEPREALNAFFVIVNKGFEGSAEQKGKELADSLTMMAGGGFAAALGGGGGGKDQGSGGWGMLVSGTLALHNAMVNHGAGADGIVANEVFSISKSMLDERTRATGNYEALIQCHGVASNDITGNANASAYKVHLKFHRASTVYQVRVRTGDVPDAGTDSHVFITIHGERGSTQEQELDDIQQNFQRGRTEEFKVVGKDVGRITGIRIRHDNKWNDKSWFLQDVEVQDLIADQHGIFTYNNWLATNKGPQTYDVELKRD